MSTPAASPTSTGAGAAGVSSPGSGHAARATHALSTAGHAAASVAHHAASTVQTAPDVSVGHALLQMVLALAVIVGSILALTKLLARIRGGPKATTRRGQGRAQGTKGLTVLSRQSLGKDLSIAAVRWGDREVLVGIAGSTITFLDDARSDEASPGASPGRSLPEPAEALPASVAAFSPALLAAGRSGAPALVPASSPGRPSLLEQLRDATLRR